MHDRSMGDGSRKQERRIFCYFVLDFGPVTCVNTCARAVENLLEEVCVCCKIGRSVNKK
jgi:hypothetical protein